MEKFALILILILSACGTTQQSTSGDLKTFTHEFEQNGLALKATIEVGKDIKVDAFITNTSKETIIYNERCGIPFGIWVKKEDASSYLVTDNTLEESCEDIFNPDDLREMKPNETFEKEITFKRKVRLTNERTVNALSGMYEMSFSFQPHDNERFLSSLPLELMNDKEPEIMAVDQAKEMAKKNKEVMKWFDEHEKENISIESEDAILSEGMWTVAFHAIHKDRVDRIIINMNAKSGNIKDIHYEKLGKDILEFLE
ncbi:hypothetical protein [Metabacillus fastidiosus]|uniref:hypothetical protein n=1 Tax=Metabacillus fastidiosus TaxID=1458 RepID=UPI0008242AE7|nr:hypothetical protein [Metabacillus fastidiosus]MED4462553.1 hypothetical protein [Metabacillus fastidiosus]